ncbi:RluA family pseudouridine synthase [Cohnella faecalis]|uniref:RluA family pseudouridine synthase n=1 Tax=Cohnella faecalis TaxID=2315694 RepID=UPI00360D8F2A
MLAEVAALQKAKQPVGRSKSKTSAKTRLTAKQAAVPPRSFEVQEPSELLAFLISQLKNEGRNSIKSILARGQVSVDGQALTAYNYPLKPGQTVSVSRARAKEATRFAGLSILHEDDDVIVINKDAGLLSIATEQEKELTAYRQLTEHVRAGDPSRRIFVLHRLDRDTSGVMMFAKSEQVQKSMQDAWKDVVKERTYVALVEGTVTASEGTISSWLKENAAMKVYSSPEPNDGQHAVTHYKVVQAGRQYSLLQVNLETGRKNQIRVHLQDIGHPIAGDKKYGAKTKPIGRLGLHASVLSFEHPRTGELMRFDTGVPTAFRKPLS